MNTVRFTPFRFIALTALLVFISFLNSCSSGPRRYTASEPAPTRILAIGDSHTVGGFGIKLNKLLRTISDASVDFYGSCGSIAKTWVTGKGTKCGAFMHQDGEVERIELVAQTPQFFTKWKNFDGQIEPGIFSKNPTHIIVEFGANYWGYTDSFIETDLDNLFTNIERTGAKCLFVSMPDTRDERISQRQAQIIEISKTAAQGRCFFFDSTKVTKYPDEGGDGIHYSGSEELDVISTAWAEAVFKEFSKQLK